MGLEQVIAEVGDGAERSATEILDTARQEAGDLLADAHAHADDYQTERLAQADRDAEALRNQILSSADFEARKTVLYAESGMRDELKAALVQGFADLPGDVRARHIQKLVAKAQDIIPGGNLWGADKDKAALDDVKAYKFAGAADIAGGIIVESKDGKNRLDLSYETLLDGLWRDILRAESDIFA